VTGTPSECLRQVIELSVIPGISMNPWERQRGIGYEGATYDVASQTLSATMRDAIARKFDSLSKQGRARLTGRPDVIVSDGTQRVRIAYVDLEAQRSTELEV